MTNINFRYWLQGLFELNPGVDWSTHTWSNEQMAIIKEHLALVKKQEPLQGFNLWLDGFLEAGCYTKLDVIATKLAESFVHIQAPSLQPTSSWLSPIGDLGSVIC